MKKVISTTIILVSTIILIVVGIFFINSKGKSIIQIPPTDTSVPEKITYLVSSEDPAKYCNGVDMDSVGYEKTINMKKTLDIEKNSLTKIQEVKAVIDAVTTGNCRTALAGLDITEDSGVVSIPPMDGWAGISISMCSCKPQVDVNLLQIKGITKVVWLKTISSFEECVASGNAAMESYPRQCKYGEQTFIENIGNELEKKDLIRLESPRPNEIIKSPLVIKGEARGTWFFEASFPVMLVDWDGKIIAQGVAQAKSDWMTTEFVPFEATLKFVVEKDIYSLNGALILRKDNPSGLPKNDDALEIPIVFLKQ